MRHVRMLCLCLCALFALGAVTASGALASKEQKEKEKLIAKSLEAVKNCQLGNEAIEECYAGITQGGKNGGYFELGKIRVPLSKPITLQGGTIETYVEPGGEPPFGDSSDYVVPPAPPAETLESPELSVPGGLSVINKEVEEITRWPAALQTLFKEAKKNKETGLKVKIELAGGNQLYENPDALNPQDLAYGAGSAFELPLKVRMISPLLERLGGGPCEFGGGAEPIVQDLTTEPSQGGEVHRAHILAGGSIFDILESRLTDLNWAVPSTALAHGCGGEYESYIDAAIDRVTGQEELRHAQHGRTVLTGSLYLVAREYAEEQLG